MKGECIQKLHCVRLAQLMCISALVLLHVLSGLGLLVSISSTITHVTELNTCQMNKVMQYNEM